VPYRKESPTIYYGSDDEQNLDKDEDEPMQVSSNSRDGVITTKQSAAEQKTGDGGDSSITMDASVFTQISNFVASRALNDINFDLDDEDPEGNPKVPFIMLYATREIGHTPRSFHLNHYPIIFTDRYRLFDKYNRTWQGQRAAMYYQEEKHKHPETFTTDANGHVTTQEESWYRYAANVVVSEYEKVICDDYHNNMLTDPLFSLRRFPTHCWGIDFSDIYELFKMRRTYSRYREGFKNSQFVRLLRKLYPEFAKMELGFKSVLKKNKEEYKLVRAAQKEERQKRHLERQERRESKRRRLDELSRFQGGTSKISPSEKGSSDQEDVEEDAALAFNDDIYDTSSSFMSSSSSSSMSSFSGCSDDMDDTSSDEEIVVRENGQLKTIRDPDMDDVDVLSRKEWLEILLPRISRTENEQRARRLEHRALKLRNSLENEGSALQTQKKNEDLFVHENEGDTDARNIEDDQVEELDGQKKGKGNDDTSAAQNDTKYKVGRPTVEHKERILPIILLPFFLETLHTSKKMLNPIAAICYRLSGSLKKYRNHLSLPTFKAQMMADPTIIASLDVTILQFDMNLETYLVYKHREGLDSEYAFHDLCKVHETTITSFNQAVATLNDKVDTLAAKVTKLSKGALSAYGTSETKKRHKTPAY
jgi:hypothetical protein